jgi:hypothetical protein
MFLWWILCHRCRAGRLGGYFVAEVATVISMADALSPLLLKACIIFSG